MFDEQWTHLYSLKELESTVNILLLKLRVDINTNFLTSLQLHVVGRVAELFFNIIHGTLVVVPKSLCDMFCTQTNNC